MTWIIEYPYLDVENFVLGLPAGLAARYAHLTDLMLEFGADLGMPHSKSMTKGLVELRVKSKKELRGCFTTPK